MSLGISIVLPSVGMSLYFYARKVPIESVEVVPSVPEESTQEQHSYTNHGADLGTEDAKETTVRRRFEDVDADAVKSSMRGHLNSLYERTSLFKISPIHRD